MTGVVKCVIQFSGPDHCSLHKDGPSNCTSAQSLPLDYCSLHKKWPLSTYWRLLSRPRHHQAVNHHVTTRSAEAAQQHGTYSSSRAVHQERQRQPGRSACSDSTAQEHSTGAQHVTTPHNRLHRCACGCTRGRMWGGASETAAAAKVVVLTTFPARE